jgi:hypothetical protein
MGLRVSGKKALIQLQRGSGTEFDISGADTDGRGRANDFQFEISGNVVDAVGYNEDWTEDVPTGQSNVTGSMTVFYNAAADEVEEYLWTMWDEEHATADCTDVQEYTMYIMPEGNCAGKTKWTISNVILRTLTFPIQHQEVLVIQFTWGGWQVSRATISA